MSPNTQLKSPVEQTSDRLTVHDVWLTVQGEGPFAGRPAIFIRLHGCNLQCPWCDTDYTSRADGYHVTTNEDQTTVGSGPPQNLATLLRWVRALVPARTTLGLYPKQLVVITGGEPFRQNIKPLVDELVASGFMVQIETNGTLFLELGRKVTIVCSPKTPQINSLLAMRADCYKYVLDADHVDPEDGLPSGTLGKYGTTARPPEGWNGEVYLQPLDEQDPEKNARNMAACVQSVLTNGYRLCVQTHKIANLP